MPHWTVSFSREAGKQYEKLKRSGSRPSINDVIDLLVLDLKKKWSTAARLASLWAVRSRAFPLPSSQRATDLCRMLAND